MLNTTFTLHHCRTRQSLEVVLGAIYLAISNYISHLIPVVTLILPWTDL